MIRLDAFAYAPKEPGKRNFFNEPETWELLDRICEIAEENKLMLLPEIHASYAEQKHERLSDKGYMTYDFFLPGLVIDALENNDGNTLKLWADEIIRKGIKTVNMLGCDDGIPLQDLKGLIPEERINALLDTIVGRGGYVKELHGAENMYYQVNAAYFSALGENEKKFLAARALQLFMPGKPQIWYLDLFAGKNDDEAVKRAGAGGHKEINRTNLTREQVEKNISLSIVKKQLQLLRFRKTNPAFAFDSRIHVTCDGDKMSFEWTKGINRAKLIMNLTTYDYRIYAGCDKYREILL